MKVFFFFTLLFNLGTLANASNLSLQAFFVLPKNDGTLEKTVSSFTWEDKNITVFANNSETASPGEVLASYKSKIIRCKELESTIASRGASMGAKYSLFVSDKTLPDGSSYSTSGVSINYFKMIIGCDLNIELPEGIKAVNRNLTVGSNRNAKIQELYENPKVLAVGETFKGNLSYIIVE